MNVANSITTTSLTDNQGMLPTVNALSQGPPDWPPKFREPPGAADAVIARRRIEHDLQICRGLFNLAKVRSDADWLFEQVGYQLGMGAHGLTHAIADVHPFAEQKGVHEVFHYPRSESVAIEQWRHDGMRHALLLFLATLISDKTAALAQMSQQPEPNHDDPALTLSESPLAPETAAVA